MSHLAELQVYFVHHGLILSRMDVKVGYILGLGYVDKPLLNESV